MVNAREAVKDLLPLLAEHEREFVLLAVDRSVINLKMRLTDWAANHADEDVQEAAQNALDAVVESEAEGG